MKDNHLLLIFLAFLATLQLAEAGLVNGRGPAVRKCRSCCEECFSSAIIAGGSLTVQALSVQDYNACQDDCYKVCENNGRFCKIDEQGKIQLLKLKCQKHAFFAC